MKSEIPLDVREKLRSLNFLADLEKLTKKYQPQKFAVFASTIINYVLENPKEMNRWPIHFILHAIEANCAYHRPYLNNEVDINAIMKVIRRYKEYDDPVVAYFLNQKGEAEPCLINMARQQFQYQSGLGRYDIARGAIIFNSSIFPKSEPKFIKQFGLTFKEWFTFAYAAYAGVLKNSPSTITRDFFTSSNVELFSDANKLISFFKTFSITPEDIKEGFRAIRDSIGPQFEMYYDSIFVSRPLLQLNDDEFLAVHKHLILTKAVEGIYDESKQLWPDHFGNEFGKSFEGYVGRLLQETKGKNTVFTEQQMRRLVEEKICDYIIIGSDYVLLLECKGTAYSSNLATETAMKKDNSTKKIKEAIKQINSTLAILESGILTPLTGDTQGKIIISIITTYKHIFFANTKWYWDNVINHDNDVDVSDSLLCNPQIMSIDELEKLIIYTNHHNRTFYELFTEMRSHPEVDYGGEWGTYLNIKGCPGLEILRNGIVELFSDIHAIFKPEEEFELPKELSETPDN